jgi:hypothetical protein
MPQPNCAKRLECAELAPAFRPPLPSDSASRRPVREYVLRGLGVIGVEVINPANNQPHRNQPHGNVSP